MPRSAATSATRTGISSRSARRAPRSSSSKLANDGPLNCGAESGDSAPQCPPRLLPEDLGRARSHEDEARGQDPEQRERNQNPSLAQFVIRSPNRTATPIAAQLNQPGIIAVRRRPRAAARKKTALGTAAS